MEVRVWWTFGFELHSLRPGPMASHTSVSKIKKQNPVWLHVYCGAVVSPSL